MDRIMAYEEYLRDVKKGIVTDLGNCPVTPLLVMLQGKWKTQILYELCVHDTVRFGVLRRELPGITNTMLTNPPARAGAGRLRQPGAVQRDPAPRRVLLHRAGPRPDADLLRDHGVGFKHEKDRLPKDGTPEE